ncbi:MAG: multiprotein bridging factor aMBF1 [Candidatus Thermoplasmatota archaeon]
MKCERCGKDTNRFRTLIEGSEMMVCRECTKYGIVIPEKVVAKIKKSLPYSKDVFEEMNKELVDGWGKKIKEARERKGLTREQLGAKIGEKTITIAKIENEELRPPDETVKKLEKFLEINLFCEVGSVSLKPRNVKAITLGDLIKNVDRKSKESD